LYQRPHRRSGDEQGVPSGVYLIIRDATGKVTTAARAVEWLIR
jgi:hypothetical protein